MATLKFLDRVTGEGSTGGAVTADIITYAIPANSHVSFDVQAQGYEATPSGLKINVAASVSRAAGSPALDAAVVSVSSLLNALLVGASATVVISGNNAIVRVTGVALKTINWFAHANVHTYTP